MKTSYSSACFWSAVVLWSVIGGNLARGAEKKEKVSPNPAHLRIWKDQFESQRPVRLQLRQSGRKTAAIDVQLPAEGWQFMEYQAVPAGIATVEISDGGDAKAKVAASPISLAAGRYFTLLLRERNGTVTTELIDDSELPETVDIAELTIRNFATTLTSLEVRVGDELTARLVSSESFVHVRGLARKLVQINTSGVEQSAKPVKWATEIDFSKHRKATLLIYPDSHGRIRPRVVIDAHESEVTDAPAASGQL